MWGADYQGETGGAYPRTPQPSMAMASLSAGLSQSFGRDTTISEEAEGAPQALPGHLPPIQSDTPTTALSLEPASPETKGPHQSAAGPIVNGSAPEGSIPTEPVQTPRAAGTLKRYTSDIGGAPTPAGGASHLKGVPDPSDWQLGMPHPDADNRHEKGVPDPSDWGRERSTPAGGEAHSRGVPDPSGTNAGWSPRSSGNTNFGVKLRPVSKSPPKSASARPTLDHHRSTSPPMNISPRR
ncbi:hypothetical protein WJX84_011848 [Apatococcus fuscideae]|uniref:Uncharacterized protein n=1 Tax=Apatococcus fuscideae TaxID=2026836 RepID=A0AAW1SPH4_9CHLO